MTLTCFYDPLIVLINDISEKILYRCRAFARAAYSEKAYRSPGAENSFDVRAYTFNRTIIWAYRIKNRCYFL